MSSGRRQECHYFSHLHPFPNLVKESKHGSKKVPRRNDLRSRQKRGTAVAKILVEQALAKAKSHTKKGEVAEARSLYATILKAFPNNKKAQQGLTALGGDQRYSAEHVPSQAVIDQLISLYRQGRLEVVVEQAKDLTAQFPKAITLWNILGASSAQIGKLEQALIAFKNVIAIKPNDPKPHNNIGNILKDLGKLEEAVKAYNKAVSLKPDYAEAYLNMGNALHDQSKLVEAVKAYNKAISLKPNYSQAYLNMGNALSAQGKLEDTLEAFNKALSFKPDYAEVYYNMGIALADQGKLEEAIEAYNKALFIKPDYAEAHSNMGVTLQDQGKLEEAIEAYNKALAIKPDYAEAHYNMSFACLAVKNFERGFEKSEWRWKTKQFKTGYLKTKKPTWSGETRQRVLVCAEQGIGDEIMFSSIIPEIYATSSKILVKCDKRLIPLFERSFSNDITYYSRDANVSEDEYDFHIPMGSLPLTFRKSLDSFKNSASGFLKCNMARAESIKGQLLHEPGKKLVGISWKTKSPLRNSSTRNINLADLARALDNSKTQLVCLQYGDVTDEISAVKRDFGIDVIQFDKVDNKYDLDGLASLILACDQIVSTTNVTVHLAGALGVKVTALLPFAPRWIWGDGSESFLYESVIPIKQKYHHNWNNVLDSLRSNSYNLF